MIRTADLWYCRQPLYRLCHNFEVEQVFCLTTKLRLIILFVIFWSYCIHQFHLRAANCQESQPLLTCDAAGPSERKMA